MGLARPAVALAFLTISLATVMTAKQGHDPTPATAAVARGKALFESNCGFCHGNDGTGQRAPDLMRSPLLSHDEQGKTLGPFLRAGRPDKGMPAFAVVPQSQVDDIIAFLHDRATNARHSRQIGNYPVAKLLTGNAAQGKLFFEGAGGCTTCHSFSKDLTGIASRYEPVDLQQQMVYPTKKKPPRTAVVTLPDGQHFEGNVRILDEFYVGVICQDGQFRSWRRDRVKVVINDPLQAHRDLMSRYTDSDVHNLFAYLEGLK